MALTHPLMLTLMLVLAAPGVAADIFTWTDEQGRVHFSDRPGGEESRPVQVRPVPPDARPAQDQGERKQLQQRMLDVYRQEREEKRAAAQQRSEERSARKEKCRQARLRYEEYNHARGIYDTDADGERRFLDHQERRRFIASLQGEVDRWCGK